MSFEFVGFVIEREESAVNDVVAEALAAEVKDVEGEEVSDRKERVRVDSGEGLADPVSVAERDRESGGVADAELSRVSVVLQLLMLIDPVPAVFIPFGHGVHHDEFVASVAFDHVSSGQGIGDVDFIGQKFPAPHATAGDEALRQYVPGRQRYEKFQTRSKLQEKPYKIRDEVTIGLPHGEGTKTEFPKSEKLEIRTICMKDGPRAMRKRTRLSCEIPRKFENDEAGVARVSRRVNVGSYLNRMIIPLLHKM